jgi:peroxiredoxin (alkyl hydroperoxide reductase subunit C)
MSRVELNQSAPDFTLSDFNGNEVSLSDFRGKKNVLLVFNRGFF